MTLPARKAVRRALRLGEDGKITALWQTLCTFVLATVAWVFFKAGSLTSALSLLAGMAVPRAGAGLVLTGGLREVAVTAAALLAVLAHDIWSLRADVPVRLVQGNRALRWALCLGVLMATLVFGVYGPGYDAQDFIYFKF